MLNYSYNCVNTNLCFSAEVAHDCGLRIVIEGKLENPLFEVDRKQQFAFQFTMGNGIADIVRETQFCRRFRDYEQEMQRPAASLRSSAFHVHPGQPSRYNPSAQLSRVNVIAKQSLRI